ncbi:hypothetical protein LZ30DRAFT_604568, partial [Colletotrichum cereale]
VIIFINMLNEYREDFTIELIQYFKHFLRSLLLIGSYFSICFSYCYYLILELYNRLIILLNIENNVDIILYV